MQTSPRGDTPIELLIAHDNEGPEGDHSARGLASYIAHEDGGYHAIFDNVETITTADDLTVVWGAGGVNHRSMHGCFIGFARQTPAEWADTYSLDELDQAAVWFAAKCTQHQIPPRWLTPDQVATPGVKGLCTHGDVSVHYPESQGHTDPGAGFPKDLLLAKIMRHLDPPVFVLRNPQGGAWIAYASGRVDYVNNGKTVHGGMVTPSDAKAFAGRTVKLLELRWYRHLGIKRAGYTIVDTATPPERYVPQGQH